MLHGVDNGPGPFDLLGMPALLRGAWRTYAAAVSVGLAEAGFDDVPRDGSYVISGIARSGAPLSEVIKGLGVSKQSAGQLVDSLVVRGYLERTVDPEDRRRLTVSLTDRGRGAAAAIRAAVERVDRDLVDEVGSEAVAHTRTALAFLIERAVDG